MHVLLAFSIKLSSLLKCWVIAISMSHAKGWHDPTTILSFQVVPWQPLLVSKILTINLPGAYALVGLTSFFSLSMLNDFRLL